MKYLFVFAFLIGSISAKATVVAPAQLIEENERFLPSLEKLIVEAVERISEFMKNNGLDPLHINIEEREISSPISDSVLVSGYVNNYLVTGLSDIQINNINFGPITLRLTYDLELPKISTSIDGAYVKVRLFGRDVDAAIAGRVDVERIRVVGVFRLGIGLSGFYIREFSITLSVDNIDSALTTVQIFGRDITNIVNRFLGTTVQRLLDLFNDGVGERVFRFILELILRVISLDRS